MIARLGPDDPRHGTPNGYVNLGCRCDRCTKAWRIARRDYMSRNSEQREKHRERDRYRSHLRRQGRS